MDTNEILRPDEEIVANVDDGICVESEVVDVSDDAVYNEQPQNQTQVQPQVQSQVQPQIQPQTPYQPNLQQSQAPVQMPKRKPSPPPFVQPRQHSQGYAQPQQYPQGYAQPQQYPQGYAQPQQYPQGYAQPQQYPQGYAQPQQYPQGYAQPQQYPQGYAQPQQYPQGYAQPQQYPQGYAQPQQYPQGYAQPQQYPQGYAQPQQYPQGYAQPQMAQPTLQGGSLDIDWQKYAPKECGITMKSGKDYKFKRMDGFVGCVPQNFIDTNFVKCPVCCSNMPAWTLSEQMSMSMKGNIYLFKCSCCDGVISASVPDVTSLGRGGKAYIYNSFNLTNAMFKSMEGKDTGTLYMVIESVGRSGVSPYCTGKEYRIQDLIDMSYRR